MGEVKRLPVELEPLTVNKTLGDELDRFIMQEHTSAFFKSLNISRLFNILADDYAYGTGFSECKKLNKEDWMRIMFAGYVVIATPEEEFLYNLDTFIGKKSPYNASIIKEVKELYYTSFHMEGENE